MHQRFELRKQQLLAECDLGPETCDGIIERLADFAQPFAACLVRDEQRRHAHTYLAGLVSDRTVATSVSRGIVTSTDCAAER